MDSEMLTISLLVAAAEHNTSCLCLPSPSKAEPSGIPCPSLTNCPQELLQPPSLGRLVSQRWTWQMFNNCIKSPLKDGQDVEHKHTMVRNLSSSSEEAQPARAVVSPATPGEAFLQGAAMS